MAAGQRDTRACLWDLRGAFLCAPGVESGFRITTTPAGTGRKEIRGGQGKMLISFSTINMMRSRPGSQLLSLFSPAFLSSSAHLVFLQFLPCS
ncbi:hypothetical protein LEMLEM_LOCUS3229 [Lemmus lemmus]